MPATWEQHHTALARAKAAGDAEAVAEIEAAISEQARAPVEPKPGKYDKSRFQSAFGKAMAANDHAALEEIGNDWTEAAQAAGKRTPRDYTDDEIRDSANKALRAGDKEGLYLLAVEAKRRGLQPPNVMDQTMKAIAGAPGAIVGAGAAAVDATGRAIDTTIRGAGRLISGEKSLGDLGGAILDNTVTMARNIPGADLIYAGGGNIVNALEGDQIDHELVQKARDEAAAMAERNPAAALAGEIAGSGVAASRALQVPGLATVQGAGRVANATRTAAAGALSEGAVGLADTMDPQQAAQRAAGGAIAAPVAEAVITAVKPVVSKAAKALDAAGSVAAPSGRVAPTLDNGPAGFDKLAQILKASGQNYSPQELRAAADALRQQRGGGASIAEVLQQAQVQRAQRVVASQPTVARAAQQADETAEVVRPQNLRDIVVDGQRTGSAQQATREQKEMFDQVMTTHGGRPVVFNNPSFLQKQAVTDALRTLSRNADPQIRQLLENFTDAIESGQRGAIRLRDVENLRVALSDAIQANPSLTEALRPVRERLKTIAGNQITEYGQGLRLYEAMGDVIEGVGEGAAAVRGSTADVASQVGNANRPRRAGQQIGMRTRMAEDAGNSYGRSGGASRRLQDPGLGERVAAVQGQAEADRLAAAGAREAQAAENLAQLNPAPNPRATRPMDDTATVADALAAMQGAGAGFKANVVLGIRDRLARFGMSQQAAEGLSQALFATDRATVDRALAVLERLHIKDQVLGEMAQLAGVTQAASGGQE